MKNINHKELEFLELNIFKISKISRYFVTMLTWFFGQNIKILNLVYRQLGDSSLGRGPVGGSASWGTLTCRISWAHFFLIHFYLMNAKNEHYFLNKINSIKTDYKVEPSF